LPIVLESLEITGRAWKMTYKFQVFFSYKTADSDRVSELLEGLSKLLPLFPIENIAIKVPHIDNWKSPATEILQSSDMLVCIVSEDTHKSEPVDWEIREAHRLGKPIIVTILNEHYKMPSSCHELKIKSILWNAKVVADNIGEMLVQKALFLKHDWRSGAPQSAILLEQYNIMVQSWESLIERRQTVNTVYTTANSALLAAIGLMLSSVDKMGYLWAAAGVTVIAFLGTVLSVNWRRTIISYGLLSRAKYKVVSALESYMPAQLFDTEWSILDTKRYVSTTDMDKQTAFFFIVLFCAIFLVSAGFTIRQLWF
jgi:hypothetical protein